MHGTPVKSCMITRAGVNWISMLGFGLGIPVRDRLDVVRGDVGAVLGAQQVLGEHLEAVREFLGAGHRIQTVDLVAVVPDLEGVPRSERIQNLCWSRQLPASGRRTPGFVGEPIPNSTGVL